MRPAQYTIGLVGSTGYTGQVMHALLMQHECMRPKVVEGRSPSAAGPRAVETLANCDAVVLATPAAASREWVAALQLAGGGHLPRIVDLSDAYRLEAPSAESSASEIHYGLPEHYGAPKAGTRIVANPGCYPTATGLALRPLLKAGLVNAKELVVHGASGASGAGKSLADHLHFCNLHENVFPYDVGQHRHQAEIERHLGHDAEISFVTTLLPIVRGLQVTAFVKALDGATPEDLRTALVDAYADHRWVTVLSEAGQGLGLRHVIGSHQAVLAVGPKASGGHIPVFASIDNLMRGAASQAVHNLNLWFGLFAGMGLPAPIENPAGVPGLVPSVGRSLKYA